MQHRLGLLAWREPISQTKKKEKDDKRAGEVNELKDRRRHAQPGHPRVRPRVAAEQRPLGRGTRETQVSRNPPDSGKILS